jgi:hypothetical protein
VSLFSVFVFRLPVYGGSHMRFFGSPGGKKFAFVFQCGLRGRSIGSEHLGLFGFICVPAASRGRDGERACHFLLDPLHCACAYANLAGNLEDALTGAQLSLHALFDGGADPRGLPRVLPASTARLRPALTRWRIMLRSNSAKAPVT